MEGLAELWERLTGLLDTPLFQSKDARFTLGTLLYLALLIPILFWVTGRLKRWAVRSLPRARVDINVAEAVATVARYVILVVGILVILQTVGIDVTALNVLAGAFGLGVGFGLQSVANNFVSGLIVLFERPVKIGDRIEVANVEGDVVGINARSTTVVTNDGIAIIVPNSKFITENVVNWSFTDRTVRFRIPVSVAYGTDPRAVESTLLEAARANRDVLEQPEPGVWFTAFGDSGMHFELRVWTSSMAHRRGQLVSALNFAIAQAFRERGIEIPFPQRDVHIRRDPQRVVSGETGEPIPEPEVDAS